MLCGNVLGGIPFDLPLSLDKLLIDAMLLVCRAILTSWLIARTLDLQHMSIHTLKCWAPKDRGPYLSPSAVDTCVGNPRPSSDTGSDRRRDRRGFVIIRAHRVVYRCAEMFGRSSPRGRKGTASLCCPSLTAPGELGSKLLRIRTAAFTCVGTAVHADTLLRSSMHTTISGWRAAYRSDST